MFKLIVLPLLFVAASAGHLGAVPAVATYAAAPVVAHAAIPLATSYANTYKISLRTPIAVAHPAPLVAAAYAAPALHAAPLAYAPHAALLRK